MQMFCFLSLSKSLHRTDNDMITYSHMISTFFSAENIHKFCLILKIHNYYSFNSFISTMVIMCTTYSKVNPLQPSGYYMYHLFNTLKLCVLSRGCACVFSMVLTANSDCFPKQTKMLHMKPSSKFRHPNVRRKFYHNVALPTRYININSDHMQ